jgi:hypothetical protein
VASTRLPFHPFAPESLAWFCQTCGDIWARALVEGSEESWRISITPCARHVGVNGCDFTKIPGSITQGYSRDSLSVLSWAQALDALPRALQNREVLCFINHLERDA